MKANNRIEQIIAMRSDAEKLVGAANILTGLAKTIAEGADELSKSRRRAKKRRSAPKPKAKKPAAT